MTGSCRKRGIRCGGGDSGASSWLWEAAADRSDPGGSSRNCSSVGDWLARSCGGRYHPGTISPRGSGM